MFVISLTPGSSDLEEHKLSWEGEGETRPGETKPNLFLLEPKLIIQIEIIIIQQQKKKLSCRWEYLQCCTLISCCWSSRRRSSRPRCEPRYLGLRSPAASRSERTSSSKRPPEEKDKRCFTSRIHQFSKRLTKKNYDPLTMCSPLRSCTTLIWSKSKGPLKLCAALNLAGLV